MNEILTAAEWGRILAFPLKPMAPVVDVFIHHDVVGPDPDLGHLMRRLNADAISEGYACIEYAFLHLQDGRRAEGRGWGVECGATKGHNGDSVPLVAHGNYENDDPTDALLDALALSIADGVRAGHISSAFRLRGHRDVRATACPGAKLYPRLGDLEARARKLIDGGEMLSDEDKAWQEAMTRRVVAEELAKQRIGERFKAIREQLAALKR